MVTFDFEADTAPFTYRVTLSDLSEDPFFGFDFLYLSLTPSTDTVDSIFRPRQVSPLKLIPGETYFANVFGTGGGISREPVYSALKLRRFPFHRHYCCSVPVSSHCSP